MQTVSEKLKEMQKVLQPSPLSPICSQTVVIQKSWLLHFSYNKTVVHFLKGFVFILCRPILSLFLFL